MVEVMINFKMENQLIYQEMLIVPLNMKILIVSLYLKFHINIYILAIQDHIIIIVNPKLQLLIFIA